jgi:prevent-host-death family protein
MALMYIWMYISGMAEKKSYSVAEARAKLPAILNEVGAGDEVYVTRRGQTAAVVISPGRYAALRGDRPTFAHAYREFLERHPASEGGVEPKYFDALRHRSPGRKVRL